MFSCQKYSGNQLYRVVCRHLSRKFPCSLMIYALCKFLILINSNTSCNPTVTKINLSWQVLPQIPDFCRFSVAKMMVRSPASVEPQGSRILTSQTCNASPLSGTSMRKIHCAQSIKFSPHSILETFRLPEIPSSVCSHEQKGK